MENVMRLTRAGILCIGLAALVFEESACSAEEVKQGSALTAYKITSRQLPSFWQRAAKDAKVLCQDGGVSIPLPDGSALWLFGDTFIGHRSTDGSPKVEGAVSSSVCRVFRENQEIKAKYRVDKNGTVDFALPLDKKTEDWSKHRIWPCGGVNLDGASYLFFARIVMTGKGPWGFKQDGSGLACARGDSWEFDRIVTPNADPLLLLTPQSVVARPDGNVYLYCLEKIGQNNSGVFLAKVPSSKLAQPKAYQHWCGQDAGFTDSRAESKPIVEDVWGQVSVAWNHYLGEFVMLHVGGMLGDPRAVYLRTAKTPWGPWCEKTLVMKLEGKIGKGFKGLIYCPYLHPELFREKGRIMPFTYCLLEDFSNPNFMEIELVPKE
jgi:hypothetical protein